MVSYVGTFVTSSTTTTATAARTQLQTTIPSHSNWTLIESTTMNAGAVPCDVYKCSSVGNGLGADFYVGVMQSANLLYLGIAEGYNSSTHKPKRPAMKATVSTQTLQSDGGILASTTELDWFTGTSNPGGGSISVIGNNLPPLTFSAIDDLFVSVAADWIGISERANSSGSGTATLMWAGAFDSAVVSPGTNDPLPLILAAGQALGSTSSYAYTMRHPLRGGTSTGWACNCNGLGSAEIAATSGALSPGSLILPSSLFGTMGNPTATADQVDLFNGGYQPVGKIGIYHSYTSGSSTLGRQVNGWYRGTYRHIRYASAILGGASWGDLFSIDSTSYFYVGSPSGSGPLFVEYNPS